MEQKVQVLVDNVADSAFAVLNFVSGDGDTDLNGSGKYHLPDIHNRTASAAEGAAATAARAGVGTREGVEEGVGQGMGGEVAGSSSPAARDAGRALSKDLGQLRRLVQAAITALRNADIEDHERADTRQREENHQEAVGYRRPEGYENAGSLGSSQPQAATAAAAMECQRAEGVESSPPQAMTTTAAVEGTGADYRAASPLLAPSNGIDHGREHISGQVEHNSATAMAPSQATIAAAAAVATTTSAAGGGDPVGRHPQNIATHVQIFGHPQVAAHLKNGAAHPQNATHPQVAVHPNVAEHPRVALHPNVATRPPAAAAPPSNGSPSADGPTADVPALKPQGYSHEPLAGRNWQHNKE